MLYKKASATHKKSPAALAPRGYKFCIFYKFTAALPRRSFASHYSMLPPSVGATAGKSSSVLFW